MKTFIFTHSSLYGMAVVNAPSKEQALQVVLGASFMEYDVESSEITLDNLKEADMSKEGVIASYYQ